MKNIIFPFLIFAFIFSCNSSKDGGSATSNGVAAGVPGTASLAGYTINEIPGSAIQKASLLDENGNVREEGEVDNNQRSGTWITYHNTEKRLVESVTNYVEGRKNGLFMKINNKNQVTDIGYFSNDIKHGRWAQFNYTRRKVEEFYKNGKLDGRRTEFYDRGKEAIRETRDYKDGMLDGDFKYFNEEGEMTLHITYKNNEKVAQIFPPPKN